MSQNCHSNGSGSRDNQQGDYSPTSPCGILEHSYPFVDPAILAQNNNGVFAGSPHIVLTCSPEDDDNEDE